MFTDMEAVIFQGQEGMIQGWTQRVGQLYREEPCKQAPRGWQTAHRWFSVY